MTVLIVNDRFVSPFQKYASLYFKRLYHEHFPGSHQYAVNSACESTLKQMISALRGSADDGVLFSGGDAGRFGGGLSDVVGEGSVIRSECPELQQEFSPNHIMGLDDWARCYEWTHWSTIMTALGNCQCPFSVNGVIFQFLLMTGFKRPHQRQMTDYWYMNNMVRPANRPYARNNMPQPWIGRVAVQYNRPVLPSQDDEEDVTAYQTWDQAVAHHLRNQAQLLREDLEADLEEQFEEDQDSDVNDLSDPLASDPDHYSSASVHYPDTEEEEHAFRVEHEFRRLRTSPVGPGILLPFFSDCS